MRLDSKGTTTRSAASADTRSHHTPNGFSAAYLDRARHVEEPPFLREARFSGSWRVESVDGVGEELFAVSRPEEPVAAEGGRAAMPVFRRRADALVAAAACSALATRCHLSLNKDERGGASRRRLGFPLHDGQEHIGHLSRPEEELLPYLHAVRCLVANPEAMSLALAAMGSEVSAQVGRAVMRRLES